MEQNEHGLCRFAVFGGLFGPDVQSQAVFASLRSSRASEVTQDAQGLGGEAGKFRLSSGLLWTVTESDQYRWTDGFSALYILALVPKSV